MKQSKQFNNSKKNIPTTLLGQPEEKYFDYFAFNIVDCGVNCGLSYSGARRRALAQTIGNARGFDINSPLSTRKITLKTCDFIKISNTTIPPALGGSTATSPPIVIVILRQQPDYVYIVNYDRATPDKS